MAAVAVPLGTFTIIKCIKKLTYHPVNTLHHRGEIELVDYIAPSQLLNTFQIDLENYQFPNINRYSLNPPSYRSEILPLYQSENGYNILNSISNSGIDFQNILDLINFITIFFS
jgi:hypothetical protein